MTSADLHSRVNEGQRDLVSLVKERSRIRRNVPERDVIAHAYDLAIYAANSRVETCALIAAKIDTAGIDHVWNRYLVVYLHAALEAYPKLSGRVLREAKRLHANGQTAINVERLNEAHRTYKVGVKRIQDDRAFISMLHRVRNNVSAHHLSSPVGLDGLIGWIEEQVVRGSDFADELVMNTLKWSMHATHFGQASLAALNVTELPPIPPKASYDRLVAELDGRVEHEPC
ncbi:hypothetical protein [Curtobacterium sp. VKM Ac-1376]|uniref:hypothetical protein n=1 Tax=Curtobacterium sp. VKM Ac-1376 TaxID=123312 RepID=UPI001A0FC900|nr:hypothetical protein [Curtobacterium sp. VKM Ac-1376]MBF4616303.1 hypothetical protein [Curtobacterium sp. VKM Ac-1376]